jgi:hypothetical protein
MAKVVCVFYDDPIEGYPRSYELVEQNCHRYPERIRVIFYHRDELVRGAGCWKTESGKSYSIGSGS